MVQRLPAPLQPAHRSTGIGRRTLQHFTEQRRAQMIRAAERAQDAAALENAQCTEVQLLVAAQRGLERILPLRERGRVEHDRVVTLATVILRAQKVERIRFYELDPVRAIRVERRVT